ncbi:MAG: ABC transporter permease [Streptosporangiaceae bacterium]|nr:ABC transporter permease [Streptosporangiaceae bacterium]
MGDMVGARPTSRAQAWGAEVAALSRFLALHWRRSAGIWVATGLLFAASKVFQPQSLGSSSLAALWPFAAVLILAAIGQTLVVQQRGIDLSVPGFISLTVVLVTHLPNGNSAKLGPAILLAYAISLAAGLANGLLITRVGITPIVQTLGMNAILYGINLGISQGTPTQTTHALQSFASTSPAGIPLPLIIAVAAVIITELIVKRTSSGRRFEASGANAAAGSAAGLRGNRYQVSAYLGAALLYCTAGVLLAGIVSQPDPFQGDNYLLPSVAAVALGGTSLLGGRGSVVASAVGALFLSQLQQFVLATGASAAVQNLVQAGALALAVTVYGLRLRPGRLLGRWRGRPSAATQPAEAGDTGPGPYDGRAPATKGQTGRASP